MRESSDSTSAGARVCLAFVLDMLLGEPPEAWHPVAWMGKAVDLADWAMPGRERGPAAERVSGTVVALAMPAAIYVGLRRLIRTLPKPLDAGADLLLLWVSLAGRSLYESAGDVQRGLASGIEEGRERASRMVGRDTAALDGAGVTRAAIESVAENCNDGVIAPLFYGIIGGAPLALAYKMINTMDSMIGYRNERYRNFGWAAARLDDAAGYIPARITGLAAALAGPAVGGSTAGALAVWRRDARSHKSPNAGVCESAFAGALGLCLGGTNSYDGVAEERSLLGEGLREPGWEDISRAANLMYASAALAAAAGVALRGLWRRKGLR